MQSWLSAGMVLCWNLHDIVKKTSPPYVPVFGLNFGSIGFLLNPVTDHDLIERIEHAQRISLKALQMVSIDAWGRTTQALAFNEVSLWRQTRQSAKIRVSVDGIERLPELNADGILVATPCGSSAYNFSVYGPIMPLDSGILALTPISTFRPRRWRGALLKHTAQVQFDVLEPDKRIVSVCADFTEVRHVRSTQIWENPKIE